MARPTPAAAARPAAAAATGGSSATGGQQRDRRNSATGGSAMSSDGLIGYWNFNEGSGTRVADSSGRNNHGTVMQGASASGAVTHPGPTWGMGRAGGNDRALSINGLDTWVRVPDSDSLDNTGINNMVTVSAWVRLNRYNNLKPYNVIAQRHEIGTRVEQFMLATLMGVPAASIHHFYMQATVSVPLNEWVHLAMTYDNVTQKLFMGGNEVASADVAWPIIADDTPFTMGAGINEDDVIEHIDGLIDDVRLYDIQLLASEVAALAR